MVAKLFPSASPIHHLGALRRFVGLIGLTMLGTLLTTGCSEDDPPPIIGDWEATTDVDGYRNVMEIDDDLEGEATIYAYTDSGLYEFSFNVEVQQDGAEWEFEMSCDGCSDFDFMMVCELDGDDLECEGDNGWSDYEFAWERD